MTRDKLSMFKCAERRRNARAAKRLNHKSPQKRSNWLQKSSLNSPPASKYLSRISDTHLASCVIAYDQIDQMTKFPLRSADMVIQTAHLMEKAKKLCSHKIIKQLPSGYLCLKNTNEIAGMSHHITEVPITFLFPADLVFHPLHKS